METIRIKNLEFADYSLKEIKIRGDFSKDALADGDMLEIKEGMKKMNYRECFTKIKNKAEKVQEIIIGFADSFNKAGHEVFPACREAIKILEPGKVIAETPFVTLEWENGNAEYRLYDSDFTEYFSYDSKMDLYFWDFSDLVCSTEEEFEEMAENLVPEIKGQLKKFEIVE